ncbi:hypothetical protein CDAR_536991 [Caerostris darwini]|uniref:Transposase n=1 Tax=Caerostris darwini TaxID=1538125 RepID=A0AAV4PJ37_9ARAC|nr:hypothetical protein CDAR_536991 [Caerostris darwini]
MDSFIITDPVEPVLQGRRELPAINFMQDDAPPHLTREVKTFMLDTFLEDRTISRGTEKTQRSPAEKKDGTAETQKDANPDLSFVAVNFTLGKKNNLMCLSQN